MRYLALIVTIAAAASGCVLVFDDRKDCAESLAISAPQRNPQTLTCESFGGLPCDSSCGPCPDIAAPIPSWGMCFSPCESLSEGDCMKDAACRVVKQAECLSSACVTDYIGCFATDQAIAPSVDCFEARDGLSCSRSPACVAYHRAGPVSTSPELIREFAVCAPEGKTPGSCFGVVACFGPPPSCPPKTRPGIAEGCYTGACIPDDLCGPAPQM